MYDMVARMIGLQHITIPLTDEFELPSVSELSAVDQMKPKLIFIAYPNNPTANLFDKARITYMIEQQHQALIVIDEAYYGYAQKSFLPELARYENVVIMRTLSKLGLAGIRLGFLIGAKDIIAELNKLRLPYNISSLTQQVAILCLAHSAEIDTQIKQILSNRERMINALSMLKPIIVYPSEANFILVKVPDAVALMQYLRKHRVLIKDLSAMPTLANCLRITVGTEQETDLVIDLIQRYYGYESYSR